MQCLSNVIADSDKKEIQELASGLSTMLMEPENQTTPNNASSKIDAFVAQSVPCRLLNWLCENTLAIRLKKLRALFTSCEALLESSLKKEELHELLLIWLHFELFFCADKELPVDNDPDSEQQLGMGTGGIVYLMHLKTSNEAVAVKKFAVDIPPVEVACELYHTKCVTSQFIFIVDCVQTQKN